MRRPASRKFAKPAARDRMSRARAIGLAAVAAALDLPADGFQPRLAALIERGAALTAPARHRLAA
jgi:hypothetical protein